MTTEFTVPGASCGHCKSTIESTVSALEGVTGVQLDLQTKRLTVEHDGDVGPGMVSAAIASAGYTPEPAA